MSTILPLLTDEKVISPSLFWRISAEMLNPDNSISIYEPGLNTNIRTYDVAHEIRKSHQQNWIEFAQSAASLHSCFTRTLALLFEEDDGSRPHPDSVARALDLLRYLLENLNELPSVSPTFTPTGEVVLPWRTKARLVKVIVPANNHQPLRLYQKNGTGSWMKDVKLNKVICEAIEWLYPGPLQSDRVA